MCLEYLLICPVVWMHFIQLVVGVCWEKSSSVLHHLTHSYPRSYIFIVHLGGFFSSLFELFFTCQMQSCNVIFF